MLYMGKDKHENEDLIKHGWDEDVWFHVDKMSSAHVYLRMPPGMAWDQIPEEVLVDAAQLTKANSIEGNKKNNITVIYTPHSNLKKTTGMETGQVTFHKQNLVKKVYIETRSNEIINRLNKTKEEKYPDLAEEKIARQKELRAEMRSREKQEKLNEMARAKKRQEMDEMKSYKSIFDESEMQTNRIGDGTGDVDVKAFEEDFM
ncbi:Coiled-coil domain-containing protein 25 [Chytridiales sp. JEL 0842]|nr:Coiled-coil domain-containing protein 25 [Chytridiales sp. JEL 0842]